MEELEGMLSDGICRKCKCHVVFAHAASMEGDRIETKKCLNCGQLYSIDNRWKEIKGDKE